MKKLTDYTDEEKIKLFDQLYETCLNELNESVSDEDRDEHYFWEGIIADILTLNDCDWSDHNEGLLLGQESRDASTVARVKELLNEGYSAEDIFKMLSKKEKHNPNTIIALIKEISK